MNESDESSLLLNIPRGWLLVLALTGGGVGGQFFEVPLLEGNHATKAQVGALEIRLENVEKLLDDIPTTREVRLIVGEFLGAHLDQGAHREAASIESVLRNQNRIDALERRMRD